MHTIIYVGIGGFIGAILRYLVSGFAQTLSGSVEFPYGTLAVNVIGCFVIGIFAQLIDSQAGITSEVRLLVMVGLLGAFTTYSTFASESLTLLQDHRFFQAAANMGVHLMLGLLAVLLGRFIIISLWR